MEQLQVFIDGKFLSRRNGKTIPVVNPSTEKVISEFPECTAEDVDLAVKAAERAQRAWAKLPAIERANHLREISGRIRKNQEKLVKTISEEQGKILPLARTEVSFAADYFDYMAEFARRYEGEIIQSDRPNEHIMLFRLPIGVVAGILPWNFPFFLIARKMAPALVTGNTVVIKPSSTTPNNAFEFARIIAETSLPEGVFNMVTGRGATVGNALAGHPGVGMVSLTGSVEGGVEVMKAASNNVTKVSLELGGKAPAIVMADADLDLAAKAIRDSRIVNTGQVCNCAERVYVQKPVAETFVRKVVQVMEDTKFGDPLSDANPDMGPLVSRQQLQHVEAAVEQATRDGAKLALGGRRADRKGFFYPATVLTGCDHKSAIMQREIFGPVLPITTFGDLDQAIELANDCEYGLTSSIYTRDYDAAMRACREIKFGETYINRENFEAMQGFHAGWRRSGIGGADGRHGLEEFLQSHVVYAQYDEHKK